MADTKTILIVDDDMELSDGLRAVLERQGHRVIQARDGLRPAHDVGGIAIQFKGVALYSRHAAPKPLDGVIPIGGRVVHQIALRLVESPHHIGRPMLLTCRQEIPAWRN